MRQFQRWPAAIAWLEIPQFISALMICDAGAQAPDTKPDVGIRFQPPTDVLLRNAQVVVEATKEPQRLSLLIRSGKIAAVEPNIVPPAAAEVYDCDGKYIYPAFVDALVEMDSQAGKAPAGYWNSNVSPERKMSQSLQLNRTQMESLRRAGVGIVLAAPNNGIIKGQSCILSTTDAPLAETLLRADVFQHIRLYPNRGASESYPNSPMGATALVRQALLDAQWYQRAQQAFATAAALPGPEHNAALQALEPVVRAAQGVVIDGTNELYALRADRLAREFLLQLVIRGSGREYRQLAALSATGRTFILPVDFPNAPPLSTESEMADATLQALMHWHLAPQNPARLEQSGVKFVITTDGLSKPEQLLTKMQAALDAGLSPATALGALTSEPARLLGIEHLAGTLEVGKLANLLVTSGPLFAKETKIEETWVQGKPDRWETELAIDPRGNWELTDNEQGPTLHLEIAGKPDKLTAKLGLAEEFQKPATEDKQTGSTTQDAELPAGADTAAASAPQVKPRNPKLRELKSLKYDSFQLSGTFETQEILSKPAGRAWLTAVLSSNDTEVKSLAVDVVWPDNSRSRYAARRLDVRLENKPTAAEAAVADSQDSSANAERPPAPKPRTGSEAPKPETGSEPPKPGKTDKSDVQGVACVVNYPLGAYGRTTPPQQPEVLLIKNATIWTCDEAGILEQADLVVRQGIISQVGQNLEVEPGATIIDATGLHVSPGIIDCHSHMATDGGVNESAQAITAEVRIGDFIDSNDITIYRQLAGGVTTANILHGSANPIGGQNQVIKLRWGHLDEELKMREAPAGIKFALGENVKQSNREGNSTRYPQSRMGVEQLIRDRFEAARDYRRQWQQPDISERALPPRRDLELEAIAEVLEGTRWVHCHSYRQDEILMILRLLDDYDVTIGSLQHILEGYKVADAMAAHGATASSFSDWWAYKMEVLDAIPYNGALMHRAGLIVSFNSDDAELARHLNHEAAKAVKYGGVEPSEALKFVTLNPAKQLRIDSWVGSLKEGKQADFVIWSRSPLSTLSVCMQTWIDGRKYFDREEDLARRRQDDELRLQLIQLALSDGDDKDAGGDDDDPSLWWDRHDAFCHHGHDEHDHDHNHEYQTSNKE